MSTKFRKQAEEFIKETIIDELPDVSVDPGSAVNAIMVRGGGAIATGLFQEMEHTLTTRGIKSPESLSEADMDTNLENIIWERDDGNRSIGYVNIHFKERKLRTISEGLRASNSNRSLFFSVDSDIVFQPTDYFVDQSDNSFFIRVPFVAEQEGPEYDVEAGEVNQIQGNVIGAIYARNVDAFVGGLPKQTNTQYLASASRSIGTRSPVAIDGVILTLQKLFKTRLLDALVIGNGDPEMLRDELYVDGGVTGLGPNGTATGVHIGGRVDVYHWYPRVNYIEVSVDLTIDLIFVGSVSAGAVSIQASFAPGATSDNSFPASGVLSLDLGGVDEEHVRYSSVTGPDAFGVYVFTLESATTNDHEADDSLKVSGVGVISVGVDGAIRTVPMIKVKDVRILDPLTLSPIGDPLPRTTVDSRRPGWRFADVNKLNFMSAKETKSIVIDEKRDAPGNQPLSAVDGVTSGVRRLSSASSDFTGYQGRDITITTATEGAVTRAVARVISANEIEYTDGTTTLTDESSVSFAIDAGYEDYLQYPVRVSYYTHTEIQDAQTVFDTGRKKTVIGNILSRVFLPVFLDFKLRYKGSAEVDTVRADLLSLIQQSQGSSLGGNQGLKFDVSDIVTSVYGSGDIDSVETPFEIKITKVNVDGQETVKWVAPSRDTVNDMVLSQDVLAGETVIVANRPSKIPSSQVPDEGLIYFGALSGELESVAYSRVIQSGTVFTFILKDGVQVQFDHDESEPLKVSVSDFDPESVIVDGVIDSDREFRPYFGTVVIEKKS